MTPTEQSTLTRLQNSVAKYASTATTSPYLMGKYIKAQQSLARLRKRLTTKYKGQQLSF